MDDWKPYADQNRRAWNEIAVVRSQSYREAAYPPEFFAGGGCSLAPEVVEAIGDVRGRRVLHLMCSTGEETMSLSVLGAQAVGVDISERQIDLARQKAQAAGLDTRFVASDIGELPGDIADGEFERIYTATGVLVWIPDIDRWAGVIAAALAPGGRFVLYEAHPVEMCLWGEHGRVTVVDDYFDTGRAIESGPGWNHFEGGDDATEPGFEFGWTLGQIVTALADAGLRIERLQEYPTTSDWRFGDAKDEAQKLPGRFLLVARRDG